MLEGGYAPADDCVVAKARDALPVGNMTYGRVTLGHDFLMAVTVSTHTHSQPHPSGASSSAFLDMAAAVDSLTFSVVIADRDGTIIYRNKAAEAVLPPGNDPDSVFGAFEFISSFRGWDAAIGQVINEGRPMSLDCAMGSAGSDPSHLCTIQLTPLRTGEKAGVTSVVIAVLHTAEHSAVEDKLEVSQRLASLGKLAARVAHELNNPLDGILRYVNLAMRAATDVPEPKLRSYLAESRTGLMRMVQIIGELLQFSRATDGRFEEADVNQIVEQAIRSTSSMAQDARVIVTADFQTTDMPVFYGSRLYQVCCNLLKNAVEAMPDGGRISVTTGIVDDQVIIRVADTGSGLPTPAEKVFQPFFTTKGPGKGTGLGLAICKDFVEDMNGSLTAEAGEHEGAVFTVRVPVGDCHHPFPLSGSVDPDSPSERAKVRRQSNQPKER